MIFKYELEPRDTIDGKLKRTQEELGNALLWCLYAWLVSLGVVVKAWKGMVL